MSKTNHGGEPERLDARRAARAQAASDATPAAEDSASMPAGDPAPPASFEESPVVIRARQIERLREAVDSGDYRPDPGKIAESMMDNERS